MLGPLASLGAAATRPGRRLARGAVKQGQRTLSEPVRRVALMGVDAALVGADAIVTSTFAREALARIAASPVADDAVRQLTYTIDSPQTGRLVAGAIESPDVERLVGRVIESPDVERLIGRALDSPLIDLLLDRVMDSRLPDLLVTRLLESDAVWMMIDEIASSPAVTAAISRQGVGFANQVAGVARDRSHTADARLERLAARLMRRGSRTNAGTGATPAPGT